MRNLVPRLLAALVASSLQPAWSSEWESEPARPKTEAWAKGCAQALELGLDQVEEVSQTARTRAGAVTCRGARLVLGELTLFRLAFAEPVHAAGFHRAIASLLEGPLTAQLRGQQLAIVQGTESLELAESGLRALWADGFLPAPGPSLELSLVRPWSDERGSGTRRAAWSRLDLGGRRGTLHGDVTARIGGARAGEIEGVKFVDRPLRNHLSEDGGPDERLEYRLGTEGVVSFVAARDEAEAQALTESLALLTRGLQAPGFVPSETTEPIGPAPSPRPGDRGLGD